MIIAIGNPQFGTVYGFVVYGCLQYGFLCDFNVRRFAFNQNIGLAQLVKCHNIKAFIDVKGLYSAFDRYATNGDF
jgi:hypothetical protein